VLHGALIGGLWRTRPPPEARSPALGEEAPIDVEIARDPPPPTTAEAPSNSPAPAAAAGPVAATAAPKARRARGPIVAAAPASAGEGEPLSQESAGAASAAPAAVTAAASAPPRDALPPPLVPRAIRAPEAVLEAPLAQRNAEAGVDAGAQVIGAARAVADTNAPRNGRGTIEIATDADGNVVRVTSTSPSWESYARDLRAQLGGKRLRVPPGARGVAVRLSVSAEVTSAPKLLTGEEKAKPCRPMDRDQAGRIGAGMEPGCFDWKSPLPVSRRRVSVVIAGVQVL
jgi:hypothetical protein